MISCFADKYIVAKEFERCGKIIAQGEVWQNTGYAILGATTNSSIQLMKEKNGQREWVWVNINELNQYFEEYNKIKKV